MKIEYKAIEKPFIKIEDHIVLPKELVDQFQKVLEDAVGRTEGRPTPEGGVATVPTCGKVISIALDTDKGFGIGFIIDIAPEDDLHVKESKNNLC